MAKEICISSTPHETRLAILEDDQLSEIYYERENEYTLAGSIYKGRVTRVLPGMQSAFVDIGLERDAFLYVTDFLEMEEPEDTDELERAATQGTPIRQQMSTSEETGSRRQGGGRDRRSERPLVRTSAAQESSAESSETAGFAAPEPADGSGDASGDAEDSSATGTRRWRGRRRRRGGRGSRDEQSSEGAAVSETIDASEPAPAVVYPLAATPEWEASPRLDSGATRRDTGSRGRSLGSTPDGDAIPFVLPGESLARYGGVPAVVGESSVPEAPASRAVRSSAAAAPALPKPSTLVADIQWDGTGLLPGESLARHRSQSPEPVESTGPVEPIAQPAVASQEVAAEVVEDMVEEEMTEATARHDVDPLPPSAFRLKDIFGGRRKDETSGQGKKQTPPVRSVTAYVPGGGPVEEEEIEVEEYELSHQALRLTDEHDASDLEEETLQQQIRSGVIGEMLHEVQLETHMRPARDAEGSPAREGSGRSRAGHGGSRGSGRGRGRGREARDSRPESRSEGSTEGRPAERSSGEGRRPMTRRAAQTSDLPIISDLLKPGQEILVQIAKEPIAQKGARITSHIALPGRFLVFMPTVSHVGVSRKIESDEERQRLKRILISERGEATGGFIVRTAADGVSEEELRADLRFLIHLWSEIRQRAEGSRPPALIYHDLNLIERILRDQVSDDFSHIWVDSEADYERIVRFLNRFSPDLVRRVKLYTKELPLFEHFGIQDEISKALRSKVWLKSGGSIVINQTEALVAIDINTGKYVGKTARLEDTILKTNLDAIPEIVRQIRLRDLGGIIVIDFIDMDERKNRSRVLSALEEALKHDRAPTKVLQFNDFGLVAITRKRVKQSLERTLSVPCPVCQATGMVKSPATVANEIYSEMRKMRKHFEQNVITLRVHPETAKVLKAGNARWLGEFEALAGKSVLVKNDATLHPEQFDIQG